jgi:hypothetical protein
VVEPPTREDEVMATKNSFALIVLVSALLFCGGCGDDDDDDTTPPLGGGLCEGCPCNYFNVAMTEDCWVASPGSRPNFGVGFVGSNFLCRLTKPPPGLTTIEYEGPTAGCTDQCIPRACHIISSPPCSRTDVNVTQQFLSQAQVDSCRACLEQYVAQLNETIPVNAPGGLTCPENP